MRKINIAFLVDGSFFPIRNGTDYSIHTLMKALTDTGSVNTNLLLSWRGWDNPVLYYNQFFQTIFLPIKAYYTHDFVLEYAVSNLHIDFLHVYNSEEVVQLASRLQAVGVKIIYEAVNIDHVLHRRLGAKPADIEHARELQILAMQHADFVLCRSTVDMNHIATMGVDMKKVRAYRGAIDVAAIAYKRRDVRKKRIVFLGHMYYPPNENALELIASHILPKLLATSEGYEVIIIGSAPPSVRKKYTQQGIVFKDGVDDLSEELTHYDIAIAPLFEGSGTRLKLLDFMASGIPVITTTLGVEGLEKSISRCVEIENDVNMYIQKIQEILDDSDKYMKMSVDGRKYVEQFYDWKMNLEPFLSIYQDRPSD